MERFGFAVLLAVAAVAAALAFVGPPAANHYLLALALTAAFFASDVRYWRSEGAAPPSTRARGRLS